MNGGLRIRPYRPADRERVVAVIESALRDAGAYFEDAPDDLVAPPGPAYRGDGGTFLVGEADDRVVATGAFRPPAGLVAEHLDDLGASTGEIKRMHVAPTHQRRGYGRRMFEALQGRAREAGYVELVLNTTTLQSAALAFYEARGFEEVRREPVEAGGRSFALVFYRKSLSTDGG